MDDQMGGADLKMAVFVIVFLYTLLLLQGILFCAFLITKWLFTPTTQF